MHFLYWALNTFETFPEKTEPGFLSIHCYFIIFNQSCSGVISSISGYIVGDEALPPWELWLWGLGSTGNAQRPTRQPAQVTSPGFCIPCGSAQAELPWSAPGAPFIEEEWLSSLLPEGDILRVLQLPHGLLPNQEADRAGRHEVCFLGRPVSSVKWG